MHTPRYKSNLIIYTVQAVGYNHKGVLDKPLWVNLENDCIKESSGLIERSIVLKKLFTTIGVTKDCSLGKSIHSVNIRQIYVNTNTDVR